MFNSDYYSTQEEEAAGAVPSSSFLSQRPSSLNIWRIALAIVVVSFCLAMSGCGGTPVGASSTASTDALAASPSSVDFGAVNVGNSANTQVSVLNPGTAPVEISNLSLSDPSFSIDGQSTFPLTLAAGGTLNLKVHFNPKAATDATGQLIITSPTSSLSATVKLHGKGSSSSNLSTLSALSCSSASMTGAGTDACTVTLSSSAPSGGMLVNLSSSNAAVTVPSSVTVPAKATGVSFTANALAVGSAQSATLTATLNTTSKSFSLQLKAATSTPTTPTLTINANSISFGSVVLNSPATQPVTLTSTGTSAVTVSSALATGAGYSVSGATFPVTLNPGQTITLSVQFRPTATGSVTGQLTIKSNSSINSTATIGLTGSGMSHEVDLNWNPPSSTSVSIAGYNVYRAPSGSASYQLVAPSDAQTTYTDTTVQSGQSYDYFVKTVDIAGVESAPSNITSVTIP